MRFDHRFPLFLLIMITILIVCIIAVMTIHTLTISSADSVRVADTESEEMNLSPSSPSLLSRRSLHVFKLSTEDHTTDNTQTARETQRDTNGLQRGETAAHVDHRHTPAILAQQLNRQLTNFISRKDYIKMKEEETNRTRAANAQITDTTTTTTTTTTARTSSRTTKHAVKLKEKRAPWSIEPVLPTAEYTQEEEEYHSTLSDQTSNDQGKVRRRGDPLLTAVLNLRAHLLQREDAAAG